MYTTGSGMTIKMPVVIGIHAHTNLFAKVDHAIATQDFPVILDCTHTSFMTSMFYRFALIVYKRVKEGGGTLQIINVDETMYDAIVLCNMHTILDVHKKEAPRGR